MDIRNKGREMCAMDNKRLLLALRRERNGNFMRIIGNAD
jgi:hypothetical protein